MSPSLLKLVVRYRTWLVALANAGITWVVLIIAPLGLFAVILCTAVVFLASLVTGWVGDRALFAVLQSQKTNQLNPAVPQQLADYHRMDSHRQIERDDR